MQNFDGSHKNFRLIDVDVAVAKFMAIWLLQAIIRSNYGLRSAGYIPGSRQAREFFPGGGESIPIAIGRERADPAAGTGVWRPAPGPVRKDGQTDSGGPGLLRICRAHEGIA